MKNRKVRNWRHLGENDSKVIKVWQLSSFSLLFARWGVCCVLLHCLKWAQWFAGNQNKVVNAAVYMCVPVPPPTPWPLHMPIQTPYHFHNAPYRVKPLIPIQTQHRLFPFQSALTVIEFTITLSQRGNFASQPISLALCFFYTVPGYESWVNNESVSTSPPSPLLSFPPLHWCSGPQRHSERGLPRIGSLERCGVNNLFMLRAGVNNSGHPSWDVFYLESRCGAAPRCNLLW